MLTKIDALLGGHVEEMARQLVAHAPAVCDFNGIRIRARYATTRPADIVAYYMRCLSENSITWKHSPEGRRYEADRVQRVEMASAKMKIAMAALSSLDFDDAGAVLGWLESVLEPADIVGVEYDRARVQRLFAKAGWISGANTGQAFEPENSVNVAGWIVGQWLRCGYPGLGRFISDWRAKFQAVPS